VSVLGRKRGPTRARRMACLAVLGTLLSIVLLAGRAQARDVIRGVDFVHPLQFSTEDQNAKLSELQSLGVHVIRFGMYVQDEDKNVDFIKRAYAHKISTVLILHGLYATGAPVRPFRPKEFPGMWSGPPLSYLDPVRSAQYFQELIGKLEAGGVMLAGLELEFVTSVRRLAALLTRHEITVIDNAVWTCSKSGKK